MQPMPGMAGTKMPPFEMGPAGSEPDLKKSEQTRNIFGFDCTRYTLDFQRETFEIWATPDAGLFPFRLLCRNPFGGNYGPPTPEDRLVEIMQKRRLFPLEVSLHESDSAGHGRFTFRVTSVARGKTTASEVFAVPQEFVEITPPGH